jgi:hypothetical protein
LPLVNLALSQATKILEDQPLEHLQVALSHQQSTLLRVVADWKQSAQSHSIDSTPSTTQSQQSPASNNINYEAFEQPVASAQDPNRSYNIQPETNQTGLQSRQRHQQSEDLVPYSTQHSTVDTSALEAPYFRGSASNPGPQLQLPTQMKVPDTAQSIRFAMKGDIDGLMYLFSQGLASPRDVSNSRGFSLVRVGLTTPSPPNLIF